MLILGNVVYEKKCDTLALQVPALAAPPDFTIDVF